MRKKQTLQPVEKPSRELHFVLLLFVATRAALTLIGVGSRFMIDRLQPRRDWYAFRYYKETWLDIWSSWDSGWYLDIAYNGYSTTLQSELPRFAREGHANYAFFPLYPMLMKGIGFVTDPYIAGLLISNVCLIVSGVFLYRLVRLDHDEKTAFSSVKYLFLFPTAFVLSGIFTESLFLALFITCFYYARREKWLVAGILGLFLALTRTVGVIAVLPLAYEYFRSKEFKLRNVRPNVLFLALLPCGTMIYAWFCYHLTGDWFAFSTVQKAWDRHLVNPLLVLWEGIRSPHLHVIFSASFVSVCLLTLLIFCRQLGVTYFLIGMYCILIPLSNSPDVSQMGSLPRYSLVIFPFYILFGRLAKYRSWDMALTASLALFQGLLMAFWSCGSILVV